jgi:hypothetical protein
LQEDIDNGLVRYFRDETSAQTDFFTFDIADSQGLRLSGQSVELGVLTPATAGASDSEVANDTQDDAGEEASEPIAVAPSESGDSSDDDSDSEDDIALIPSNASNETFQQFIDRVATLETETNQLSKGSRIAREVTDPELVNEILIGLASQQKRNAQRDHEDADWEQNDKESFAQDTFLLWQKLEESSKTASIDLDVRLTVGTITVLGTFGGILWALRGGALMAVAFANLPGWNFVDPLPILESHHRRKLESKEGDLANFF